MPNEIVSAFENEIATKSQAAADFYARVHDRIKVLADELCSDSRKSKMFGREFIMLTLTEKKVDQGIAFRRLDIKSQYVSAYIAANGGEPGEFRACVGYDVSPREAKHSTLHFPAEATRVTPEELADRFVRSIVLPNDEPFV